jgi:hypothetical protein
MLFLDKFDSAAGAIALKYGVSLQYRIKLLDCHRIEGWEKRSFAVP